MRATALILCGLLGLAVTAVSADAAPIVPARARPQASNVLPVAAGCGWGFHRTRHGHCARYHHYHYRHRRHWRHRYYGYHYPPYPYYGGYNPWYGPSPNDYMANQLNAQELAHGGY